MREFGAHRYAWKQPVRQLLARIPYMEGGENTPEDYRFIIVRGPNELILGMRIFGYSLYFKHYILQRERKCHP